MGNSDDIIFVDIMAPGPRGDDVSKGLTTPPRASEIGCERIDDEHQSLLDFINEGWLAASDGNAVSVHKLLHVLSSLQQRLRQHFEHEEVEMARLNYPAFHEHAARHATALARLCGTEMRLTEARTVDREALYALFGALIDDIVQADLPFKSFVQQWGLHASGRIR